MKSLKSLNSLKWLLILSLLLIPLAKFFDQTASAAVGSDQLILTVNTNVMVHNGSVWKAAQPLTAAKGVSFVALKGIAQRYGYTLSYNSATKESIASSSSHVIRFKLGSSIVYFDNKPVKALAPAYVLNNSLMVPLRTWAQLTESSISVSGSKIILTWNVVKLPTANFEIQPKEIYAGETYVTYIDHSTSPNHLPFVDERWEGKMDIFPQPGSYTVTRQVQDASGQWSEPYSVTVQVKAPNQPPVADFSTDKQQYRIGEDITYNDLSYDDENAIVKRTWSGNSKVFFESGDKSVSLEVEDRHGLTHTVTKTITITNEVLYSRDDYSRLFTAIGEKFPIDGASVLKMPALPYKIQNENAQLVRSNSPETLLQEGIAYTAQITGQVRFMIHNLNHIGYPVKIYLLATNHNSTPVNVSTSSFGMGGPDPYVVNTGKLSTIRYLNSLAADPSPKWKTIRPGKTEIIMDDISKVALKQNDVLSAYGDVFSDQDLNYSIVVVAAGKNPVAALPSLSVMERKDVHVRGTFNNANRTIEMNDTLGVEPQRITLGDRTMDTYLDGIDETSGQLELNLGNFGVLYRLKLPHVAPHTLIALNARGGYYTGAFMVNGRVVPVTNSSILKDNSEAAVLYRTGASEESVDIVFTLAAGSNLPLAMMFLPLPGLRW
ncbi:stalk domain-containing protein [Paenibacillus solisilvae]|uniref:Stalk domain-containing protein n=1 Tax=Paenibacillus solisilvae TaxID=2486751 RepID=A0ABW0W0U2_9BACL